VNQNDEFLYSIAQIAISGIRDRMAAQFPDNPKLAGQTAACIMAMLAAELFRCVIPQDGAARAINTYLDMSRDPIPWRVQPYHVVEDPDRLRKMN
jgi:hypothetical protein